MVDNLQFFPLAEKIARFVAEFFSGSRGTIKKTDISPPCIHSPLNGANRAIQEQNDLFIAWFWGGELWFLRFTGEPIWNGREFAILEQQRRIMDTPWLSVDSPDDVGQAISRRSRTKTSDETPLFSVWYRAQMSKGLVFAKEGSKGLAIAVSRQSRSLLQIFPRTYG